MRKEQEPVSDTHTFTATREQRVVRVFVSSTFRDMHAERDELIKRTFPQLRRLCEERGVGWSEVDLRWGITEEQSQRGEVLPICLAEIQRCRPYFIGLLGERYGWVPHEIPNELIEQEPWLQSHLHHSVTELEILHGVLNDLKMSDRAFFYFRDPAFIDSLPSVEQPYYLELPTREDIEKFGQPEAERHAQERRQKLAALKARLIASGQPVENYQNPRALGELVLRDLTDVINRCYPQGSEPDPLDRESLDHDAFAQSRAQVYIGRQSYYNRLNEHVQDNEPPLVVLGESGSGKSALLSNWALQYRSAHPEEMLLVHFIGATSYSADWTALLRRIMGEFKRRFNIQHEIPDKPDELREAFANWLHMASAKGRVVLILDALNQLEDRDGAPDLVWLPPEIPPGIRLILSTLPGRSLDELKQRGWPRMQIEHLAAGERQELISAYLAQHAKQLNQTRVGRIANANQTANPLYLRVLLDELRVFGIHEELDERIAYYLRAATIPELYERILKRYEEDYERDRVGLVRDAMGLLWASRRGLSEAELLDLLGSSQNALPRAYWSPLYLAAEASLVSRSGLLGFAHDYFREAVKERYVATAGEQSDAHLHLANYFETREMGRRKLEELPWQLSRAGEWPRLFSLLASPAFFPNAWEANSSEVKSYWTQVEANSTLRLVDAYQVAVTSGDVSVRYFGDVATLLHETGHLDVARTMREHIVDSARRLNKPERLAVALNNLGFMLDETERDKATELLGEAEQICRRRGDKELLKTVLGNKVRILLKARMIDDARPLIDETKQLCRELHDLRGLQAMLGDQAILLRLVGELDQALSLHKEEELLCRQIGYQDGLADCLTNQASLLLAQRNLDASILLQQKAEEIYREMGNKEGLQLSLGNRTEILWLRGDLRELLAVSREREELCRELNNRIGIAASLSTQALVLEAAGDLQSALELNKSAEEIYRNSSDSAGLGSCLGNRAVILETLQRWDEAMQLLKEQEQIARNSNNKDQLASSLGEQALILKARGQLHEALELLAEQERINREIGNLAGLATALINHASFLANDMGRAVEGLPLAEEAYRLAASNGLVALAKGIKPILDSVRHKAE
jgi:tetratricopeptide (TPR) repeat protein